MRLKYLPIILLISIFFGCDEGNGIDKRTLKKAIDERKIVRLSDAEMMDMANVFGQWIADSLLIPGADSGRFVSSVKNDFDLRISILSLSDKSSEMPGIENELIEAYRYNMENGLPLESNLQKRKEDIVYTAPLKGEGHRVCFIYFNKAGLVKNRELYKELSSATE
ncbi:MAG: hypothetical protein ACK4ND_07125 [Cytophagaceae bacterium]